ncbi:hypothetical protein [Heyndrickxia oleronia]|uniref:hypothetical protein n=1 Tax=Heyndrickxia oleronia TaxID=38875 RepID=UPI001C0EF2C4|nr:hypothetical protein [Heyndrickxia oleronia]MBU5214498.1 hypothetical protein [Heyndrickxia oleronia]
MAKAKAKEKNEDVELIKETEHVLVFKANRRLNESEFNLLSDLVRQEEKKAGVKIILMPNSVDIVEGE